MATMLMVNVISAQTSITYRLGAKAGFDASFLHVTGNVKGLGVTNKTGVYAGLLIEVKLSDRFYLQPEVLYSMQGAEVSTSTFTSSAANYENTNSDIRLGYINVPVMAKYYVGKKFSFEAGPQLGFLVSAKNDFKHTSTVNGSTSTVSSSKKSIKSDLKSVDFGLNFGVGYDFTQDFSIGLRYSLGLSDISKDSYGDNKMKNNVFSIGAAYKF